MGDTFESRIRAEIEEETNARVVSAAYRFVVENRFLYRGKQIQSVEHYLEVVIDRQDVISRESHLVQQWLPISKLKDYDLRPTVVRDAIAGASYMATSYLNANPL